eukprot:3232362-Prymnesium_polylepis.2
MQCCRLFLCRPGPWTRHTRHSVRVRPIERARPLLRNSKYKKHGVAGLRLAVRVAVFKDLDRLA